MYDYGLIFWNPKTDIEICVIFQAKDYFDAEDVVKTIELEGYIKRQVTYIENKNESYYHVSLAELAQHPNYKKT